ncbi:uncharacterized protein [Parasteatoda tepidariorum]|uniref:uncharacterized protein n=2 Tax=Parasteatoda tepidariorum TaxID=114398 RepID=UPI001C71B9E4|nr:uncharacterized protein LOC122268390 [Parasteatoda tepidariorum]
MSAGRKKDPIWVYYNEKIELGKKGSKAICNLCQKEMQGLVSRMKMHHEVCVAKNEVEKKKDCEQEKDALDVTATYNRGTDNKAQIESQNLPDPCNKRIQCDEDLTATDTDIKIKKFKTTGISPFIVKMPTNLKDTLDLQVAKFFFSSNIYLFDLLKIHIFLS